VKAHFQQLRAPDPDRKISGNCPHGFPRPLCLLEQMMVKSVEGELACVSKKTDPEIRM
jgi:hypothetical protein